MTFIHENHFSVNIKSQHKPQMSGIEKLSEIKNRRLNLQTSQTDIILSCCH